ncbi:hypothetical protein GF366_04440 [Candidatus Peregrinibacteria bacterium]|nr:hypothetical protein [Candidatus Peregrinibacteria bacterium]
MEVERENEVVLDRDLVNRLRTCLKKDGSPNGIFVDFDGERYLVYLRFHRESYYYIECSIQQKSIYGNCHYFYFYIDKEKFEGKENVEIVSYVSSRGENLSWLKAFLNGFEEVAQ